MPSIHLETFIAAPIERCFDLMRDVDLHTRSAARTHERAVAGVMTGLLEQGDEVAWEAVHLGVKQRLTVRITRCEPPHLLVDEMVRGAFKSFTHRHEFRSVSGGTVMTDDFRYTSPLGLLGAVADWVFLKRYMRKFLYERALFLKQVAERENPARQEIVGHGTARQTQDMRRRVGAAIGVLIVMVGLLYACFPLGRPIRWEVPEGYQGFYGLQEGNPACPALRNDGIEIVVGVPATGCACTSDELPNLWRSNHLVSVRPDGSRVQDNVENIPFASAQRQQTVPYPFTVGFIGTRQDVNTGVFGSEVDLERRCGWLKT